jgi:hypothetical protein
MMRKTWMNSMVFNGTEYRQYDHLYWVSAAGGFLRLLVPYEPILRPDGYLSVGRQRLAHRMVATCWCDRPEGATDVHHINHDKADNRDENLVWLTIAKHIALHPDTGRQPMPESAKAKLRAFRLGMKASEETKQKQREATLRLGLKPPPRLKGTKMGKEFFRKCRENSPNARACVISGTRYRSFNEAGEAHNQKPHTLRKRCLSDNFPDYRLAG